MDAREFLFRNRSYTPLPILLAILIFANPTPWSLSIGFIMALSGEFLRMWAVQHAGGATRTTGQPGAGADLITHGPFAFVRNPLYLGNLFLSAGLCIMSWAWMPWMLLIFLTMFAIQYSMIISLEEEQLQKRFGDVYQHYLAEVPRFIPRITSFDKRKVTVMPLTKTSRVEKNTLISFTAVATAIFLIWVFSN